MREVELKLTVRGSFVMPPLFHVGVGVADVEELPTLDLKTTYYDTPDLRLARNGATLRHRTGEQEGPRWTLKLPQGGGAAMVRDEQHFESPAGQVPRAALDLATAYVRSGSLSAVASLRTRRHRWILKDASGGELAEVVDDEVSVYEGRRAVGRFRELEVEDRTLGVEGLGQIADLLKEAGATTAEPVSKAVRALGARATAQADAPREIEVGPSDPSGRALQRALARGLHRLLANDAGARLGDDPESVHQMRVATRRLRSDLRTLASLVEPSWLDPLRSELKWLGESLGRVRDLDVQTERLRASSGELLDDLSVLFEDLGRRHSEARDALLHDLQSTRYKRLLDSVVDAVAAPVFAAPSQAPCAEVLPPLVARAWRKLSRAGRALNPDSSEGDFHRVRIKAKRARYAAEAVGDCLGTTRAGHARRFARRCAAVQDVLGEMQDAVVAIELIRSVAREHPRSGAANLALGRLLERQQGAIEQAKSSYPEAWEKVDAKKNIAWMKT
jgi:CHAD domain-containing protein/uncharacterized protein YjbK